MTSWLDKPLSEIGAALRSGDVSARGLLEEAEAAHEKFGATLNAYRVWDAKGAQTQADAADAAFAAGTDNGPLQGIPVSVKDLFGLAHLDIFAGSPKALPDKWREEGPVIKAVLAQSAVITGKTHMVEFAFGGLGTNQHWPVPRNPWDSDAHRIPGGSSSGAGVSLIEGSAALALGSDTAGSVRVPASVTGTVGLKVTAGRWPLDGIVPLSPTLDTPGILTRSVADAAVAFEVIDAHCAGRTAGTPAEAADLDGLRIGLCEKHFWQDCPTDIAVPVRNALFELDQAGARSASFELPECKEAYELFRQASVVGSEFDAFLKTELPDWIETLDPNVVFRMSGSPALGSKEIATRRERMAALAAAADERLQEIDILVSPTVPVTAPTLEEIADPKAYSAANGKALRNTCIANLLGLSAITLPVGLDNAGIPVGMQCIARANCEERLLEIATAIEKVLGTPRERLGAPPLGI